MTNDRTPGQRPQGRDRLPWSKWRNANPIGRFLSGRFGINSPKGLIPIVLAALLGALLLLGVQAVTGVFNETKSSEDIAQTYPPINNSPDNGLPPSVTAPTETDPYCDLGTCAESYPTVTVVLGKEKFDLLDDSMLTNLFCLTPTPVGVECDPVKQQRVLKQVLTAEQLVFLDEHGIESNVGDWEFIPEGSARGPALGLTAKPTQTYDVMTGTVVLMNP